MDKEPSTRSLAPIIENQSTEYNGTNTEDDEKNTADKEITYHKTVMVFHRGHSFPVMQGMTFHTQRKIYRNNIKRDIGCHILNGLNFKKKAKRNLKSDPFYHLLKKTLKKVE